MEEARLLDLCETLDGFVNLNWMQRGNVIGQFYSAARRQNHNQEPLIYTACRSLVERVPREGLVIMSGGNIVVPTYLGIGETDGPAGIAVLARALVQGLNASSIILAEEGLVPGMTEVMRAAGFAVVDLEGLKRYRADGFALRRGEMVTTVQAFPDDDEGAKAAAAKLLAEFRPSAVIASEKIGMNSKGVYHASLGTDMSEGMARVDYLFRQAQEAGVLTIGIGDGGNEIGYGVIEEAVRKHKLFGDKCRCPCGGGLATATGANVLITAEVSNWGAYALAGAFLSVLDKAHLVHDWELETRILDATGRAGFIHLATEVGPMVDGFSLRINQCVVEMIRDVCQKAKLDWFTARMNAAMDESKSR